MIKMMVIWVLGVYLKYAIDKYGKEHFIKEIICECSSEEEMNLKEEELVNPEFVARNDTYNLSVGGNGGKRRGDVFADKMKNPEYYKEFCEKNRERMLRLLSDEQWRKKFSQKISAGLKKFYKINRRYMGR